MKRSKFLFLSFMAVFLLLLLLPASAEAEDSYGLFVCGVQVTSANQNDILGDGTVRYDSENMTLTIQGNKTLTLEEDSFLINEAVDGLTVVISGTVEVGFQGECAVQLNRSTTLTGGGSLSLAIEGSDGISVTPTWEEIEQFFENETPLPEIVLTIDHLSLSVKGDIFHGIMGNYNAGLVFRGADVNVQTMRGAICDFYGCFILEDCKLLTPSGGTIICGAVAELVEGYPEQASQVTISSENAEGFITNSFINENGLSVGWTFNPAKNTFTANWENPEDCEPLLVASYNKDGRFLGVTVVDKTGEEKENVLRNGASNAAVFWLGEGSAPQCGEERFHVAGI